METCLGVRRRGRRCGDEDEDEKEDEEEDEENGRARGTWTSAEAAMAMGAASFCQPPVRTSGSATSTVDAKKEGGTETAAATRERAMRICEAHRMTTSTIIVTITTPRLAAATTSATRSPTF